MNDRQCIPWCTALASAFVFAACAGPAPIDHFYSVDAANPSSASETPLPGTLHVEPLRSDGLVGQRQLLYRQQEDSAEIRRYGYHLWTDPPAIALQTELVGFLRAAAAAEIVMEANARTRPNYTISGRIHRFEQVLGGDPMVVVELDLTVTGADGALLVHEKVFWARHKRLCAAVSGGQRDRDDLCRVLLCLRRRLPAELSARVMGMAV